MTEQEYCMIIGIKEVEIYNLTKHLEAARAQLKELARDRNDPVQPHLPA